MAFVVYPASNPNYDILCLGSIWGSLASGSCQISVLAMASSDKCSTMGLPFSFPTLLAKSTLTLNAQLLSSYCSGRTPKSEIHFYMTDLNSLQSSISKEIRVALAHARAEYSTLAMSQCPTKPWGWD